MFESIAWEKSHKVDSRRRGLAHLERPPPIAKSRPALFVKNMTSGEHLFSRGEPKECLYRVESGVIEITWMTPIGIPELVERVEAGDVFGLGYLDYHLYDATAITDCSVSFWPRNALAQFTHAMPELESLQADAVEREFLHLRSSIVASPGERPVSRLAAFLSVVSRMNAAEGRDPNVVDESMQSDVVAEYLRMDLRTLGQALVELQRRGLVTVEPPHGLRISDPEALDRVKD
ncbi:MAG: Crp/Fnr family transcriptional regulator [Hyphomicrobium sp.]